MIAGREPMEFDYDVTFDDTGKVDTMNLQMHADMGWAVMQMQMQMQMLTGCLLLGFQPAGAETDSEADADRLPVAGAIIFNSHANC